MLGEVDEGEEKVETYYGTNLLFNQVYIITAISITFTCESVAMNNAVSLVYRNGCPTTLVV